MFRCPVCAQPLAEPRARPPAERCWRCPAGHGFDVAREGYVNLLITHQRRRRPPGDSAAMLGHRRAFLDAGHYGPLAAALAAFARPGQAVLDVGCGEGYYTRTWPEARPGLRLWAVDIAKPAVRMAAGRRRAGAHYAVASAYDLPVLDASIDLVVSVFAPLVGAEFERVLRPGGLLVTVVPGPDHLAGLKARLFAEPSVHPGTGPFQDPGATSLFRPETSERLRYDLHLATGAEVEDLLGMTPYAWYVAAETRAAAAAGPPLSTPVDFRIDSYRMA